MISLGVFSFLVVAIPMAFVLYVLKRFYNLYEIEIVPRRREEDDHEG